MTHRIKTTVLLAALTALIPMEEATPATAHLFFVNPLSGRSMTLLFSTHPPTEKRIARLLALPSGG